MSDIRPAGQGSTVTVVGGGANAQTTNDVKTVGVGQIGYNKLKEDYESLKVHCAALEEELGIYRANAPKMEVKKTGRKSKRGKR